MKSIFVLAGTLALVSGTGCAGKAPKHNGYPAGTSGDGPSRPWARPTMIALDARGKLTAEFALSYPKRARAKWLAVDLPAPGALMLALDVFATSGDQVPVDLELYDATLTRIASKGDVGAATKRQAKPSDGEPGFVDDQDDDADQFEVSDPSDAQQQWEYTRLPPGRYLIHAFVKRRLDAATLELTGKFTAGAGPVATPSAPLVVTELALPPPLPLVPVTDDTPGARSARDKPREREPSGRKPDKERAKDKDGDQAADKPAEKPNGEPRGDAPGDAPTSARIINVSVVAGGTEITINRGTDHGLAAGVAGQVIGVKQGSFSLAKCAPRTCKATVKASTTELAAASKVTLAP